MKQIALAALVKLAAAADSGGGTHRMVTSSQETQPHHNIINDRILQVASNTVKIGGTAFFDINGDGRLDIDQGDGNINPISNTAINVMTELWSCENGQNLGYQATDENGNYLFTVPAQPGRACYYVRYDSSTMEGSFSCSGQPKCATGNLMLSAGQEALNIDVGIQASDFDALLKDSALSGEVNTDDGYGWSGVSGVIFEPTTYVPTYVLPSRPSPSVSRPPPISASSPTLDELTPIPTNEPTIESIPEDSADSPDQQVASSSGLIQLNSQIRVILSNIESLEDNSKELFEDVCDTFLNEQLAIAVPPISYISCSVVNQSVVNERRELLRKSNAVERLLISTVAVDVDVTGVALPTRTIKTEEQVKFTEKLVGVFKAQGDQFLRLLKKEEAKIVPNFNEATFPTLDKVWAVKMVDDAESGMSQSNESKSSSISVALIAGIAAGGAILLLLVIYLLVRCRGTNEEERDVKMSPTNETESSPIPRDNAGYYSTPIQASSGFEVDRRVALSAEISSRVKRDVIVPPGKLRILVANTQGYGPAIHTIKPNSPVEGLLFVGDIIVAVNNTNTRKSKADEITRLLRVTVKEERKITVLSLRC